MKAIQALPLIESGAADRLGLDEAEIALACASHSGEPAHIALGEGHAGQGRARRRRARVRRALAARRRGRARAGAFGRKPSAAAQQLLRQARRLRLPRLRRGDRPQRLRRARPPRPARRDRGARRRDRRKTRRGKPGDRRLLDPGLRDPASRAGVRICALRNRARASAGARPSGALACALRSQPIRRSWRGRGGSIPK